MFSGHTAFPRIRQPLPGLRFRMWRASLSRRALRTVGYLLRNLVKVSRDRSKCRQISLIDLPSSSIHRTVSRLVTRTFNLVQLPFLRPRTVPSASRRAKASLVHMEIRLRSSSATRPKAKHSTLLLMESSKQYLSFVVYRLMPLPRHLPMMAIRSVSVRLRREISVTMMVSPRFMRRSSPPSLRSLSFRFPLTISVTQLSTLRFRLSAKRRISSS